MRIQDEIALYESHIEFLEGRIVELAKIDAEDATENHLFLAEAIAFRIYRGYERFSRALFLHCCTARETLAGAVINSKLQCEDWDTAEEILKAGNRFLDWGKPETTKRLSDLIFHKGFPINDVIGPIHSTLIDLQRVRNYIAHDSVEAQREFRKVTLNYIPTGSAEPERAGLLLLTRKRKREAQAIRKIFNKISALSSIFEKL